MIKRFGSGYFAVTLDLGRPDYARREILENSLNEDSQIFRLETEPPNAQWICYSLTEDDKEKAFVRGYYTDDQTFHIQKIKNLLKDRISGYKHVPRILNKMEADLKLKGVENLTTSSYLRLAPIAMKRFGFEHARGDSIGQLKKSLWRFIPRSWTPLKKSLK